MPEVHGFWNMGTAEMLQSCQPQEVTAVELSVESAVYNNAM
jgi:hypothetical protein